MTREELIEVVRKHAAAAGTTSVPRREFLRISGVSERTVQNLFGSYTGLIEAAGLSPLVFPSPDSPKYSSADMTAELVRVLRLPSSKLTTVFFEQSSGMSLSAVQRRFGGWRSALRAALAALDPEQDAATAARIADYLEPEPSRAQQSRMGVGPQAGVALAVVAEQHEMLVDGSANVYGDFINFRGLQHAPVNEQGVVFLFGMVCRELGYVVELVRSGFPDCEAKRRIIGKAGKWQRVRIEFEFQARNFVAHGHDPDQCDVIVCWDDNWPECPLDVLELRSAIVGLSSGVQAAPSGV